jgi:hypothetical protein
MADRAATRLAIDLGFAALVIACAVTVYAKSRAADIPAGVCSVATGTPRYDAMLADGQITVAAVFGELSGGPIDTNAWSYRAFAAGLRERGFVSVAPGIGYTQGHEVDRYRLGNMTIDLVLVPDDPAQSTAALAGALAGHDVVYYNGHSHDGDIVIDPPADYRALVLDSCWSTQHVARGLIGTQHDVITNSERSVTGSVESALVVVDALRAHGNWPIGEMNALAIERARARAPVSKFKEPERYRIDVPCK